MSKHENIIGTPEKPLSDLGKLSYLSYWRYKIYRFFYEQLKKQDNDLQLSLEGISKATNLNTNDVASTLQWCKLMTKPDDTDMNETSDNELVNYLC